MGKKIILTNNDIQALAEHICDESDKLTGSGHSLNVYAIPRGGIAAAYAIASHSTRVFIYVDKPEDADIFIDDLIDSGDTMRKYQAMNIDAPFYALLDKRTDEQFKDKWVVFPWETKDEYIGPTENIVRLLEFVGEDVTRGGLKETPARVLKAWQKWTEGYDQEPADIFKVFEDGAEGYDQMISVVDIPFYSHCEHHMALFFGTVTVSYIPDGRIVGLSKLSRLVNVFARRLQVQERLTANIADAVMEHLKPLGVGVVVKARHMCMESRGVCQQGHHTVTSALHGVIKDEPETRAEFTALAK